MTHVNNPKYLPAVAMTVLFLGLVVVALLSIFNTTPEPTEKPETEEATGMHSLVNFRAIRGGTRRAKMLKNIGIKVPRNVRRIRPDEMFPNGVGNYASFEKKVLDILQPEDLVCEPGINLFPSCKGKRIRGASIILSFSPIGTYGTMPYYHVDAIEGWGETEKLFAEKLVREEPDCWAFQQESTPDNDWAVYECFDPMDKCMLHFGSLSDMHLRVSKKTGEYELFKRKTVLVDLKADWEKRLEIIHKYMGSPRMQDDVTIALLKEIRDSNDSDPWKMAMHYFTGKAPSPSEMLKNLVHRQLFGPKHHYGRAVTKCFEAKAKKKDVLSDEDVRAFLECVKTKEIGKRKKRTSRTSQLRKKCASSCSGDTILTSIRKRSLRHP